MLSEGSTVKGSPEDKQPSGPYIKGSAKDFTAGQSGTLHRFYSPDPCDFEEPPVRKISLCFIHISCGYIRGFLRLNIS